MVTGSSYLRLRPRPEAHRLAAVQLLFFSRLYLMSHSFWDRST